MRSAFRVFAIVIAVVFLAGCSGSDPSPSEVVAGAFEETGAASGYRTTVSTAQTFIVAPLGINTSSQIDPDNPSMFGEVIGERSHIVVDMTAAMGGLLGGGASIDYVGFEMWVSADRVVTDTRGFQSLADLNPGADFGPYAPGIAYVDLVELGAETPELLEALVGNGVPDLSELAERFPRALVDIVADEDRPGVFYGTMTYAAFLEATGADVEDTARSIAAGLALSTGSDVEKMTALYVDFYSRAPIDVTIEIGDGVVRVIETDADLSALYLEIFDDPSALGLGDIPADQLGEMRDAFADAVLLVQTRTTYEPDDNIVIPAPPAGAEDRTTEYQLFLAGAGFGN